MSAKDFKCDECFQEYDNPKEFIAHCKSCKADFDENRIACFHCGLICKSISGLKRHSSACAKKQNDYAFVEPTPKQVQKQAQAQAQAKPQVQAQAQAKPQQVQPQQARPQQVQQQALQQAPQQNLPRPDPPKFSFTQTVNGQPVASGSSPSTDKLVEDIMRHVREVGGNGSRPGQGPNMQNQQMPQNMGNMGNMGRPGQGPPNNYRSSPITDHDRDLMIKKLIEEINILMANNDEHVKVILNLREDIMKLKKVMAYGFMKLETYIECETDAVKNEIDGLHEAISGNKTERAMVRDAQKIIGTLTNGAKTDTDEIERMVDAQIAKSAQGTQIKQIKVPNQE